MNEELEICHSLENVNCDNETPSEPKTTNEIISTTETKIADEIIPTVEPTGEPTASTESSNTME